MRRTPTPALGALVREIWASDGPGDRPGGPANEAGRDPVGDPVDDARRIAVPRTAVPRTAVPRTAVPRTAVPRTAVPRTAAPRTEHLLPTGWTHVVFRLDDAPLDLIDPGDGIAGRVRAGPALIGGVRARYYVREIGGPSRSVGFVLQPGAAWLLLGAPAGALAQAHTPLEALWGLEARRLRERLLQAADAAERLLILETALLRRARSADRSVRHGPDPAIAAVLPWVEALPTVAEAVRRSGYSHRHFISRFRDATGLAPAAWRRVRRFRRSLRALARGTIAADDGLAALAIATGFSDQAHFNREFRAFAGVTPAAYRRMAPPDPNHLPVGPGRAAALTAT